MRTVIVWGVVTRVHRCTISFLKVKNFSVQCGPKRVYYKRDMKTVKSCGKTHGHCKICRPDMAAAARAASLLPFAQARSREAGQRNRVVKSVHMKQLWADPEWRRKTIDNIRKYPRECSVAKCSEKHNSQGWCVNHYQRWRAYGSPTAPLRKKGKQRNWAGGVCAVDDCEKEHSCGGYCTMHWERIKKNGEPGQAAPLTTNERYDGCSVEGCKQPHCAKELCTSHYNTLITSPQRRALKRGSKSRLKPKQWLVKLKEYDYRCAYCGVQDEDIQQDHIRPLSKGGHHTLANVVPACGFCNRRKHDYVNRYLPMSSSVISACFSLAS